MSLTLRSLYEDTKYTYKMKTLAGKNGFYHNVAWVHFTEDTETIKFIENGELIIITGYTSAYNDNNSDDWLLDYIKSIYERGAAGLIINTGKYIDNDSINQSIIDYCDDISFPLITMPWEIYISEVLKDYCKRIINFEFQFESLTDIFRSILMNHPLHPKEESRLQLAHYPLTGNYTVVAFKASSLSNELKKKNISETGLSVLIEKYFDSSELSRMFFSNEDYYVLLFQRKSPDSIKEYTTGILEYFEKEYDGVKFIAGIGNNVSHVTGILNSYEEACESIRYAEHTGMHITVYDELGFNKILFSVKDQTMLDTYISCLNPVIEYDRLHSGQLTQTLYIYLKNNKSIQQVAEKMYCHRNTVNYRIHQISELLELKLDNPDDIFMLTLAFRILKYKRIDIIKFD